MTTLARPDARAGGGLVERRVGLWPFVRFHTGRTADLGARLNDRESAPRRWRHGHARAEAAGKFAETGRGVGAQRVEDPRTTPFTIDPAGFAKDLEVVRDRWLADVAAGREVARAHLGTIAQLAQDGESGRVGGGLQKLDIGVGLAFHVSTVLTKVYLDKYQYRYEQQPLRGATWR